MEFQVVLNYSTTFQSAGITFQVPSNSVKISITINGTLKLSLFFVSFTI